MTGWKSRETQGNFMTEKNENELTVVNNEIGYHSTNNMNDKISGYLWQAQEELPHNITAQEAVIKSVVSKKIIDTAEYNFDISRVNAMNELHDFLNLTSLSETTKKNYTKWLNNFIVWCNSKNIDCRKIERMQAENYLYFLVNEKNYSPNSARSMILSVSSFYTFLSYRFPDIVKNVFYKLHLPTIIPIRKRDFVTDNDLIELRKEFKKIHRNDIVCFIDLIKKYGFRVGIFENMKIDLTGHWTSVSKEKVMNGKFTESEVKKINETGLLKLRKSVIENIVWRYTKKLFDNGKITCSFSVHDIRHWYITKFANETKSITEFAKFSKTLHKDIRTTMSYINVR
jgi:site-specific recombinase XerD